MTKKTLKIGLFVVAFVVAVYLVYAYNKKGSTSESTPQQQPETEPPATQTGTGQPMPATDPRAVTAIKSRATALYNSNRREQIFASYNTRETLFSGLQYRNGVRTVLSQQLASGNADQFPLIPPFINPSYAQKLTQPSDLEGFEAMTSRGQFQLATQLWANALDFELVGGPNLWPPYLLEILSAGLFYVSGSSDSNQSERYDSYCKDMAKLCLNASRCCEKAQQHLEQEALIDLNANGWQIY